MLLRLTEEEINEVHKQCRVEYAWKTLKAYEKQQIIISALFYDDLDDFIETNIVRLLDMPEIQQLIFKDSIIFNLGIEQNEKILKRLFKRYKSEKIIEIILFVYGIKNEQEFIIQYLDELHDEYLAIDNDPEHWCVEFGYNIIHINEIVPLIIELTKNDNQQKIIDEYLETCNVSNIYNLSKQQKEQVLSALCPIMY
jgi:hypothetical protein